MKDLYFFTTDDLKDEATFRHFEESVYHYPHLVILIDLNKRTYNAYMDGETSEASIDLLGHYIYTHV